MVGNQDSNINQAIQLKKYVPHTPIVVRAKPCWNKVDNLAEATAWLESVWVNCEALMCTVLPVILPSMCSICFWLLAVCRCDRYSNDSGNMKYTATNKIKGNTPPKM